MEFVGVFLVFSVSIKCCRAGDGITLLAALLVLASPTFDKEFIINDAFAITFVPEVIYR